MTNSSDEPEGHGIEDDQLPDDVRPGDDNPLAEGLDAGETAGDNDPVSCSRRARRPTATTTTTRTPRTDRPARRVLRPGVGAQT